MKHAPLPALLSTLTALIGLGAFAAPAQAAPCDPASGTCSVADEPTNSLKASSTDKLGTNFDTGWVPKCETSGPHCDKSIQFKAALELAQSGTTPVYEVDLSKSALLSVEWPDTENFVVSLVPTNRQDGTFGVTHTLIPTVGVYVNFAPLVNTEVLLDATDLVQLIPQSSWSYKAAAAGKVTPWGFTASPIRVTGVDLQYSKLFETTFDQIAKLVGVDLKGIVGGKLSLTATTDIAFTYQTTEVKIQGATGAPITAPDGTTTLPIGNADFVEVTALVKGKITYGGTGSKFSIGPAVEITQPVTVPALKIDVASFDVAQTSFDVTFPSTTYHIPLPNVFVPTKTVDFGTIETGVQEVKKVTIENTGELEAQLQFASSDPNFTVAATSATAGAEGTYELTITYRPQTDGAHTGKITVSTNDPDSPDWEFEVKGIGEGEPEPGAGGTSSGSGGSGTGGRSSTGGSDTSSGDGDSADDSGCGCRAARGSSTTAGALALLGLALLTLRRRR